jgi:hypothetical protein
MIKYQGSVFQLPAFKQARINYPFLNNYVDAFKAYWLEGYHPHIGKDIATARPNPPEGHRHAHLIPSDGFPTDKGYKSSKICWDKWQKADIDIAMFFNTNDIPTSEHGIFYAVDIKRNAYLFHYQATDMHAFMKTAKFTDLVVSIENQLYSEDVELMSIYEQNELFKSDWQVASNDDNF